MRFRCAGVIIFIQYESTVTGTVVGAFSVGTHLITVVSTSLTFINIYIYIDIVSSLTVPYNIN